MKCSEFLKKAKDSGWTFLRQGKGSHEVWTNGEKIVVVPNHGSKEMPKGTEKTLRKAMGF